MADKLEKTVHEAGRAYTEGRYEDAQKLYEAAIIDHPSNGVLYANLSAIHLKLRDTGGAITRAEQAVKICPSWAKGHYRLGEAHKKAENMEKCLMALCQATRLDPSNCQVFKSLLESSSHFLDNFPDENLRKLGLDKDRSIVLSVIGQAFYFEKLYPDAILILSWALELAIESNKVLCSVLGAIYSCHFELGDFSEALYILDRYDFIYDGNIQKLNELKGKAFLQKGDFESCINLLMPLIPHIGMDSVRDLNIAFLRSNRVEDSLNLLNSMILESDEDTMIQCTILLTRLHIELGNFDIGWRLGKRLLKYTRKRGIKPENDVAHQLLASICEKQNNFRAASCLWAQVEGAEARLAEAKCHVEMMDKDSEDKLTQAILAQDSIEARSERFRWRKLNKTDFEEDLQWLREALKNETGSKNKARIYQDLASATDDSKERIILLEQSLTEAQDAEDFRLEMDSLNFLGHEFEILGQVRKAEGFYRQQLEVARQLTCLGSIGHAHFNIARLKKDLEETRYAITAFKECNNYRKQCEALIFLAETERDREIVIVAAEKAFEIAECNNFVVFLPKIHTLIDKFIL